MTHAEPLRYRLQRLSSDDFATYGQIVDAEENIVCVTLELPWRNNEHDVSCVPAGEYAAHRRPSERRGYEVFELDDLPPRTNVEMHIGNLPHDSLGCILIGARFEDINGQHGIADSRVAFAAWMHRNAGYDSITLTIVDPPSLQASE